MAKQKRKNRITKHHLIPKSRGGENEEKNIKECTQEKHQAFNTLFTDFYLEDDEIILILKTFGSQRFIQCRRQFIQFSKKKTVFENIWRRIFVVALMPDEIMLILKTFGQSRFLKQRKRKKVIECEKAWETLGFEGLTDEKVIEKIKNEWSPKN